MEALIETRALARSYEMGGTKLPALAGVDLRIERGEFVAIMGPSGSGKSTLMNLLGCLDRPTAGSYRLAGEDVSTLDDDRLAEVRGRRIGFVFQSFNLIPRTTAFENVEVPLLYQRDRQAREKARSALAEVGLSERMGHRPNELSGGERQRVAIARAIVTAPDLVLADEPTGNLDSHSGAEIMAIFEGLNRKGVTVILVTHDPEVAGHARRIVRLKDGRVVEDGSR